MKALPRSLGVLERQTVLKYLQPETGLQLLQGLLDDRSREMEATVAKHLMDVDLLDSALEGLVLPLRDEQRKIEYARTFLETLYRECLPDSVAGSRSPNALG